MNHLRIIPTAAFLFVCLNCFSQSDEKRVDPSDYKVIHISIPRHEQTEKFPFRNIHVYDIRHDTSCLGIDSRATGRHMTVLNTTASLAKEVRRFYLSSIDSTGSDKIELHCFIRKMILSDHIYVDPGEDQRVVDNKYEGIETSGIMYTAEFYSYENGLYTPVCRFDSLITGKKTIGRFGGDYIAEVLTASLVKASLVDKEKIKAGRHITLEALETYNKQRINYPVLNASPAKGVFLTFKDFQNNTPAYTEFTVDKNPKGDYLYIKNAKGQDELLREVWGYCDGQDYYIFSANNYFRMYRIGNGFKVYGAKDFTSWRNPRLSASMLSLMTPNSNFTKGQSVTKYNLVKDYFQLDMETGEMF